MTEEWPSATSLGFDLLREEVAAHLRASRYGGRGATAASRRQAHGQKR